MFKYILEFLSISGKAQHSEAQAEAEHSLCWHSQCSSYHPPPWSPRAPGTKARLRDRHMGTSHSSCHLPAPHLAIHPSTSLYLPVPSALPLARGLLCGAPWYRYSHPTPPALPSQSLFLLGWAISHSQVRVWSMADLQALSQSRCEVEMGWSRTKAPAYRPKPQVKPCKVLSTHPRQNSSITGSSNPTKPHREKRKSVPH